MKRILLFVISFVVLTSFLGLVCSASDYDTVVTMTTNRGYYTDSDGYKYEITVTLSPWILYSKNTDLLKDMLSDIGNGHTLPSPTDWGFKLNDNLYRRDYPSFYYTASNFDMYYTLGTISVKNVTDGFDISASAPRSLNIGLSSDSFWTASKANYTVIGKAYFSNDERFIDNVYGFFLKGLNISLKLHQNSGTIPIVLAHGESSTPADPSPGYDQLRSSGSISFGCSNGLPEHSFFSEALNMELSVIRESLEYTSIKEPEKDEIQPTVQDGKDAIDTSGTSSHSSRQNPVFFILIMSSIVIVVIFVFVIHGKKKKRAHKH